MLGDVDEQHNHTKSFKPVCDSRITPVAEWNTKTKSEPDIINLATFWGGKKQKHLLLSCGEVNVSTKIQKTLPELAFWNHKATNPGVGDVSWQSLHCLLHPLCVSACQNDVPPSLPQQASNVEPDAPVAARDNDDWPGWLVAGLLRGRQEFDWLVCTEENCFRTSKWKFCLFAMKNVSHD